MTARFASGPAFRIEGGKSRGRAFLGFREDGIHLKVSLPLKCSEGGIHGALHQRLHFCRARVEFEQRLLRERLCVLQEPLVSPVRGASRRAFKFRNRVRHRFVEARVNLRLHLALRFFQKFLRPGEFAFQLCRLLLQPLRHLFRLAAVLLHLFFPMGCNF